MNPQIAKNPNERRASMTVLPDIAWLKISKIIRAKGMNSKKRLNDSGVFVTRQYIL